MLAELEDPYILIHEKKLSSLQPMLPVLEVVVQAGKPLVMIAEDVEGRCQTNRFYWSLLTSAPVLDLTIPRP